MTGKAYGAGLWGQRIQFKRVHFRVFSTSLFAPPALTSDWIFSRGVPADPLQEVMILGISRGGPQLTCLRMCSFSPLLLGAPTDPLGKCSFFSNQVVQTHRHTPRCTWCGHTDTKTAALLLYIDPHHHHHCNHHECIIIIFIIIDYCI